MAFYTHTHSSSASRAPSLRRDSSNTGDVSFEENAKIVLSREAEKFRTMSKNIPRPMPLLGVSNYVDWKEDVELSAKTAGVLEILHNPSSKPSMPDQIALWNECNMWLYCLIWETVADAAKAQLVRTPTSSSAGVGAAGGTEFSAFALWKAIEETFLETPESMRRRLITELILINHTTFDNDDRMFVLQLVRLRTQLEKIKYPLPPYLWYDVLHNGLSRDGRDIIDRQIKSSQFVASEADFGEFLVEVLRHLPVSAR